MLAEVVWCESYIRKLYPLGGKVALSVCGDHWIQLEKEMIAVSGFCMRFANRPGYAERHPIEAKIFLGMAEKLAQTRPQPFTPIRNALKLLVWLPEPVVDEDRKSMAIKTVFRLPVLDEHLKADLLQGVSSKPGRPPVARKLAVVALEMHYQGQSWAEIERELCPSRQNVANPGELIRREVQLLKVALREAGVPVE